MTREQFEAVVAQEFPKAIPERFRALIKNVGFAVEIEPSQEVRTQEGLSENETLLGLYHGIPLTERGENYGVGIALPDTITLFQRPIEEEAKAEGVGVDEVIRETMWHEVAHHFGLDEDAVILRERERREKGGGKPISIW